MCSFSTIVVADRLLCHILYLGRIGTEVPPDIAVALLFGAVVALMLQTPLSMIHTVEQNSFRRFSVIVVGLLLAGQIAFVLLMNPYDEAHPKRMYYQHTKREWFTNQTLNARFRACKDTDGSCDVSPVQEDSGIFITAIDFLNMQPYDDMDPKNTDGTLSKSALTLAQAPTADCNDEVPWQLTAESNL